MGTVPRLPTKTAMPPGAPRSRVRSRGSGGPLLMQRARAGAQDTHDRPAQAVPRGLRHAVTGLERRNAGATGHRWRRARGPLLALCAGEVGQPSPAVYTCPQMHPAKCQVSPFGGVRRARARYMLCRLQARNGLRRRRTVDLHAWRAPFNPPTPPRSDRGEVKCTAPGGPPFEEEALSPLLDLCCNRARHARLTQREVCAHRHGNALRRSCRATSTEHGRVGASSNKRSKQRPSFHWLLLACPLLLPPRTP
jgi:hypothetical protein